MPITNLTPESKAFTWLDVVNPTKEVVHEISSKYNLHLYTLKDCLEPAHLPKHEHLGDTHFIITRMLTASVEERLHSIQEISSKVAIFYNSNLLITVHRTPQAFIEEIGRNNAQCNKTSNEFLIEVIWNVLHTYDKPGIELSLVVDGFETNLFLKSLTPTMMEDLYYIKRKAAVCKKLLTLSGEVINSIRVNENETVALQDVKDLHLKLVTMYDQVSDDATNLLNIYLSLSAQKTNEVMKVLTIFSVFFMPLTFIAGIYGMNFEFMPELQHKLGYPSVILAMVITSGIIWWWFKRKRWL